MEKLAKQKLDQTVLRKNMEEQADQSLTLPFNGGLFHVTPELISFTMRAFERNFLKDIYNNPISFTQPEWLEFHDKLRERYNEVMNDWCIEFEDSKQIRKPEQL